MQRIYLESTFIRKINLCKYCFLIAYFLNLASALTYIIGSQKTLKMLIYHIKINFYRRNKIFFQFEIGYILIDLN